MKERSFQNVLTHGFTAVELALPTETPETIQAEADAWFERLDPEGTDQIKYANFAVLCSLRVERFPKSEAAIIAQQVRDAELKWDCEKEHKLKNLKKKMCRDYATAYIELKTFVDGVAWLLQEWLPINSAFEDAGCFTHIELLRHSLRLRGIDSEDMMFDTQPQEYVAWALACATNPNMHAYLKAEIGSQRCLTNRFMASHPNWQTYDHDESFCMVAETMLNEINSLLDLHARLKESETASRAAARVRARAMVPANTKENRLLIRYSKSAATDLDRSLKSLERLKKERREEAEREAEESVEADFRNEPEDGSPATTKGIEIGSYVRVGGVSFGVYDKSETMLSLAIEGYEPKDYSSVDVIAVPEVDSTPLNGV